MPSTEEAELQRLQERARTQAGVTEILRLQGNYEDAIRRTAEYLAIGQPRAITTASDKSS